MENKIIYLEKLDYNIFSNEFSIILNGRLLNTKEKFLQAIEEKLQFPYSCNGSLDSFLDWMRDLSWINSKKINIIITEFKDFLTDNLEIKDIIMECFKEDILPFWEDEVKTTIIDGETKEFNIYLVI